MAHSLAQVLFVEDQASVAAVIMLELGLAHIGVTIAPNGEQGLALAREHKFDLILLDQWLPGMDGLEICRHLKRDAALQGIPVIFFTAFPSRHHEHAARRLGAADYLQKGIIGSRLAARILAEVEVARPAAGTGPEKPSPAPPGDAPAARSGN